MTRREFIGVSSGAAAGALLGACASPKAAVEAPSGVRPQPKIPRWRGFNLTEMLGGRQGPTAYRESDFQWMAEWGFTFARLPLSYWAWSSPKAWMTLDPRGLEPIDRAVELGRIYGIHICLNLHRIPGYCVNGADLEPFQLFSGPRASMQRALDAAAFHWASFADRYRSVPSARLSFDLMNEPPFMADQGRYVEIVTRLTSAIRERSPQRLILVDGADIGQSPVPGIVDLGVVQSSHDYQPKMVTHYKADWVPEREFESHRPPTWPMVDDRGVLWNRDRLRSVAIAPWKVVTDPGVPVHVGEWGCFNLTPHAACLGWMSDMLALWKEVGWGWSLWNLRGAFGVVDSARADVDYENFRGHKLDRRMLELLLEG